MRWLKSCKQVGEILGMGGEEKDWKPGCIHILFWGVAAGRNGKGLGDGGTVCGVRGDGRVCGGRCGNCGSMRSSGRASSHTSGGRTNEPTIGGAGVAAGPASGSGAGMQASRRWRRHRRQGLRAGLRAGIRAAGRLRREAEGGISIGRRGRCWRGGIAWWLRSGAAEWGWCIGRRT